MGLLQLPNEITLLILERLAKERLKRMRLVCKKLADLGAPLLMDVLYISPRSKDTEVFESVIQHPTFKTAVKHVIYEAAKVVDYDLEDYFNVLMLQLDQTEYREIRNTNHAIDQLMKLRTKRLNYAVNSFKNTPACMEDYHQYCLVARAQDPNFNGPWFAGVCEGLRKLGPVQSVTIRNTWDMIYDDDMDARSAASEAETDTNDGGNFDTSENHQDIEDDEWEDCQSNDSCTDNLLADVPGLRLDGTRLVGSLSARAWRPTWLNPSYTVEHFHDRENVYSVYWEGWHNFQQDFALVVRMLKMARIQPDAFRIPETKTSLRAFQPNFWSVWIVTYHSMTHFCTLPAI